jgi:hypothetical protein
MTKHQAPNTNAGSGRQDRLLTIYGMFEAMIVSVDVDGMALLGGSFYSLDLSASCGSLVAWPERVRKTRSRQQRRRG